MTENLNGFLIVRKANSMQFTQPYNRNFIIDQKFYEGIDRGGFYDLIDDFFIKKLPLGIFEIMEDIIMTETLSQPFVYSFDDAVKLLNYCEQKNTFNEIIYIEEDKFSDDLTDFQNFELEWLGYDLVTDSNNSLLFLGLFSKPLHFKEWIPKINMHGLFDDANETWNYFNNYSLKMNDNVVEDFGVNENDLRCVRIAKVKV